MIELQKKLKDGRYRFRSPTGVYIFFKREELVDMLQEIIYWEEINGDRDAGQSKGDSIPNNDN